MINCTAVSSHPIELPFRQVCKVTLVPAGVVCMIVTGVSWQVCGGQRTTLRAGSPSRVSSSPFICCTISPPPVIYFVNYIYLVCVVAGRHLSG